MTLAQIVEIHWDNVLEPMDYLEYIHMLTYLNWLIQTKKEIYVN